MISIRKAVLSMAISMSISAVAMAEQGRYSADNYEPSFDYVSLQYGQINIASKMEMLAFDYSQSISEHTFASLGISTAQDNDNDRITFNRAKLSFGGKHALDFVIPAAAYIKAGAHYSELKNKDNPVYFFPEESMMKDHGYLVDLGTKFKPFSSTAEVTIGYGVQRYNNANTTNKVLHGAVDMYFGEGVALTLSIQRESYGDVDVTTKTIGFKLAI